MSLSNEERDELRSAVRGLLADRSSSEQVRRTVVEPPGFDESLWEQMVDLGWTTIHVPEAYGGSGGSFADLAVVLHELGRSITPSPFLASAVLASSALALAADSPVARAHLTAIAGGSARGAVAMAGAGGSYDRADRTALWDLDRGSVRVDGSSTFVLDADVADVLLVVADGPEGVAVVAVDAETDGVHIERAVTVDETRRLFSVSYDGARVERDRLLCEPGPPAERLVESVLAIGVIAASCDATGAAELALERASSYARERTQFGKPIGSFQAVKHHCADMAISVEASRAATRAGAEALDGDAEEWPTIAAVTASFVGPACAEVGALGIRVHGGIGFTWEEDAHLLLKRAKLDEVLFGSPSWHRRRLADAVFPSLVGP